MKPATNSTKKSDIQRAWHLIDLKGETLGRISTNISKLLMGKSKPYFVKNLDCGDYVVAINAKEIKVTGKKEQDKKYYRHSGYPGGFREETVEQVRAKDPRKLILHSVKGMLPQNRLRDRMTTRLFVFPTEVHPYTDKFKNN